MHYNSQFLFLPIFLWIVFFFLCVICKCLFCPDRKTDLWFCSLFLECAVGFGTDLASLQEFLRSSETAK